MLTVPAYIENGQINLAITINFEKLEVIHTPLQFVTQCSPVRYSSRKGKGCRVTKESSQRPNMSWFKWTAKSSKESCSLLLICPFKTNPFTAIPAACIWFHYTFIQQFSEIEHEYDLLNCLVWWLAVANHVLVIMLKASRLKVLTHK